MQNKDLNLKYIKKYQTPSGKLEESKTLENGFLDKIKNAVKQAVETASNIYNYHVYAVLSFPRRFYNRFLGGNGETLDKITSINGPGTDVVYLDNDVIRVTPDTELRGTLFNEFVEDERNGTIRTAEWYKNNQNASVGDHDIPVKNFSYYGGIENGAFKVMPLSLFNDSTTIIPARNLKNGTVPIKEIIEGDKGPTKKDLLEELKELHELRGDLVKNYVPWHTVIRHNKLYNDPYIVPNTGKILSKEEMDNIAKRLHVYNIKIPGADSLNYLLMNTPVDKQEEVMDLYSKRRVKYINDLDSVKQEKLKSIESFSSALTPEEELIQRVSFNLPYDEDLDRAYYGGFLKFGEKLAKAPYNIVDLLLPYNITRRHHNPLSEEDKKFLRLYDTRLWDMSNKAEALWQQIEDKRHELKNLGDKKLRAVTINNDTIPISTYNASVLDKKAILGNDTGGIFIADFNNLSKKQLDEEVNPYLSNHPSVFFMPDMGSYSLYGLLNGIDPKMLEHTYMDITKKPTYGNYWWLFTESESKAPYNPKVHYLVGVEKQGGKLK